MAVTVEWSLSSNFSSSVNTVAHGNVANGGVTSGTEIFVRHDGSNPLTSCTFYIQPVSSGYDGSALATSDFTEVTTWGAGLTADSFGGIQINMDKTGNYTSTFASMSHSAKDVTSTGTLAFTARIDDGSGAVGVSTTTGVPLHLNMNLDTTGELPTGATPDVGFKVRIKVPQDEDTAGIRQVEQVLRYTFTS